MLGSWCTDEGFGCYAHYALGYDAILASMQERTCCRFDDGVTILSAVVNCVAFVHYETFDMDVWLKSRYADMLHATGDIDDAIEVAIVKRIVIEACHSLGDVDAVDIHVVDAVPCHRVHSEGAASVSHRLGQIHLAIAVSIFILVGRAATKGHLHGACFGIGDMVIYTFGFKPIGHIPHSPCYMVT